MVAGFTGLTRPFNTLGVPALSVPCGFDRNGAPIGLQLVGRPFDEAMLYRIGHAYQGATDFHQKVPVLGGAPRGPRASCALELMSAQDARCHPERSEGPLHLDARLTVTLLRCVKLSSMPSSENSRPMPLCL